MNPMLSWRAQAIRDRTLGKNAKYLLLYLSTFMNDWGDSAFPTIATVAGETGLSRATVFRAIAELEAAGWLLRQNEFSNGRQIANHYVAAMPKGAPKPSRGLRVRPGGSQGETPEGLRVRREGSHGEIQNSPDNSPEDINTLVAEKPPKTDAQVGADTPPAADHFATFWADYPRKVAKAAAEKVWRRLSTADRIAAITALRWYPFATDHGYIPHPATWLNGRRWEDDIPAEPQPGDWTLTETWV